MTNQHKAPGRRRLKLSFDLIGKRAGEYAGSARLEGGHNLSCCPFCRGYDVEVSNTWTAVYSVHCNDCGAIGPSPSTTTLTTFKTVGAMKAAHRRALTAAIDAWDDRL